MLPLIIILAISLGYLNLMWVTRIGINKLKSRQSNIQPTVTVIVSLKNEASNIQSLSESLHQLDYPIELLDFILVDDGSTDSTLDKLNQLNKPNLRVIQNKGVGKKSAIETAIAISNAEWILTTDADCELPKKWIQGMLSGVNGNTKMILGPVFIQPENSLIGQLQTIEFCGLQGATAGLAAMGRPVSANGANMMYQKSVFEALKPYDDNRHWNTGDDQFLLMAVQKNYPGSINYAWNSDAIITTHPVSKWSQLFKQRIRWASKGGSYSDFFAQIVGLTVVLFSLSFFYTLFEFAAFQNWKPIVLWGVARMLSDYLVIQPMARFSNTRISFGMYLLSAIFYPFIVLVSFFGGLKVFFTLKKP